MLINNFNSVIGILLISLSFGVPPVVTDIPDETIAEGGTFGTISLNDYVSDIETADADIDWTYTGDSNLTVSITSQVATITAPTDWNGSETITFTATDTGDGSDGAESDSDNATFIVTPVNDAPTDISLNSESVDESHTGPSMASAISRGLRESLNPPTESAKRC